MAETPKIVQTRLAAQQGAQEHHPDADLLNTFMEQRLSAVERSEVLAHLSVCPKCREVLALAAPEVMSDAVPAPRRLFGFGFTQWGTIGLSTAAVIAFFVMIKAERPVGTFDKMAQVQPAAPASAVPNQEQKERGKGVPENRAKQNANIPAASSGAMRSDGEPAVRADKKSLHVQQPRAADSISTTNIIAGMNDAAKAKPSEAVEPPRAMNETVQVQASAAAVPSQAGPAANPQSQAKDENRAESVTRKSAAMAPLSELKPAVLDATRPDGLRFRAEGATLWKADSAGKWQRVAGTWSGNITALAFSSNENGELVTSSGETWITSDGGEHWKKK
jgi:hypothetical protein